MVIEDVRIAQRYMTTHEVMPWRQAYYPTTTTPSLMTQLEVSTVNQYETVLQKLDTKQVNRSARQQFLLKIDPVSHNQLRALLLETHQLLLLPLKLFLHIVSAYQTSLPK